MRIETTYYADDGTEFYSKEACEAYEKEWEESLGSVLFFDEAMNPLTTPEELDDMWYLFIVDEPKSRVLFSHISDQRGTCVPTDAISYSAGEVLMYDEDGGWFDSWINLSRVVADYAQKIAAVVEGVSKNDN